MSDTLTRVRALIVQRAVSVSRHGFRELAADDILLEDLVTDIETAMVVEDYPAAVRGPSVLLLHHDAGGRPVHALWGLPKDGLTPAVLVTAYRPDPQRWSADFTKRKTP